MFQKRNDLEIIEILRKNKTHVRLISQKLDLPVSTVLRTLNKLEKELVVDFDRQGKNKIYEIKQTLEAEIYLNMSEKYKLIKIIQNPQLRSIIKNLKEEFRNELIILFGSYAKGIANKNSDVDIFIETNEKITSLPEIIQLKTGKLNKENFLTKEIIKNHVIIQNVDRFFEIVRCEELDLYKN